MSTIMKSFLVLAMLVLILGVVVLAMMAVDVNSVAAAFEPIQIAGGACSTSCGGFSLPVGQFSIEV